MDGCILEFKEYLSEERGMALNSSLAYGRDLNDFNKFLAEKNIEGPKGVTNTEIISYLFMLKNQGKSAATVNRKLASLRTFFNFMIKCRGMENNPTDGIRPPKIAQKELEFLTVEEIDKLLASPDDSVKGRRDKALLEMLYASGIRVSEAAGMNISDINLHMGLITVDEELGKPRAIPLGRPAREALEKYINEARQALLRNKENDCQPLFLNYAGERLTRQGIWKIINENAKAANIEAKITPKTLRNSFAVHMVQNGADIKTLQLLLGHEDVVATQVYLNYSKNRIKDVYDNSHPRA